MSDSPRRELPPLPNLDKLKKDAKARLAEMRARAPSARLADAQFVLAREHGFSSWAALKAEVEKRADSPAAVEIRESRARGALHRAEVHSSPKEEPEPHSPEHFLRLGFTAIVIFAVAALLGLALVFLGGSGGAERFLALLRALAGRTP